MFEEGESTQARGPAGSGGGSGTGPSGSVPDGDCDGGGDGDGDGGDGGGDRAAAGERFPGVVAEAAAVVAAMGLDPATVDLGVLVDQLAAVEALQARMEGWKVGVLAAMTRATWPVRTWEDDHEDDSEEAVFARKRARKGLLTRQELTAAEIAPALRIAASTAAGRVEVALELSEDLPGVQTALAEGRLDYGRAATFAVGTRDLPDWVKAGVEEKLLPLAPRMTRPELRAAVAAKVIQIDPVGADARHAKAAQDREVNFAARADGTADCFAHGPADVIWGLRNWLYPAAAAAKTPDDERTADQRRFDVFADLLDEAIRRAAHQEEEQEDPCCSAGCGCDGGDDRDTEPERVQHPAGTAPPGAETADAKKAATDAKEATTDEKEATTDEKEATTGTGTGTGIADAEAASTDDAGTEAEAGSTSTTGCDGEGCDGEGCDGEGCDGEGCDGEGCDGEGCDGEGCDGEGCDGEGPATKASAGDVMDAPADVADTERNTTRTEGVDGAPGDGAARSRHHPPPKRAPHTYRGGLHAQLHVVVPATSLIDTGPDQPDPPAMLTGYGPIPPALARAIAADAAWRRLVTDPFTGRLVDYGTTRYRPPQYLEDFVEARDQTCVAMGCRLPARLCDTDHDVPFPQGPTNEANLGKKCRWHHRCKTHGGWTTSFDTDTGTVIWTSPLGKVYEAPRVPLTTPLPRSAGFTRTDSTTTSTERDDVRDEAAGTETNAARGNAGLTGRRSRATPAEDVTIGEHDERRSQHRGFGGDEKPPF